MNRLNAFGERVVGGLSAGLLSGFFYDMTIGKQDDFLLFGRLATSAFAETRLMDHLLLGAVIGIGFAVLLGRWVASAGSGLMWGVTCGILWWISGPLTLYALLRGQQPDWSLEAARSAFPLLLGYLVAYGAFLGVAYRFLTAAMRASWRLKRVRDLAADLLSSIIVGGMAGLVGGLAFGAWMERVGMYPLVAGLVRSDSPDVGKALHFAISVIIGASYGALFRRDIRGAGSSVAWGVGYGFIWWILGPLTIMPWWLGQGIQWSVAAGQKAFPSLIGHLIYGILLGLVYSVVDRFWRLLFTESDPLRREPEGPGTRSLRAVGSGALASVAGGLAFTIVMVRTGALPVVASLMGRSSPMEGFWVHMVISTIIGATYGLLFQREAYTYGAGLLWGLIYGMIWWFLGRLTLMPILLGGEVQWSSAAAIAAYPSLIGHLAYGGTTALVYQLLAGRYDPVLRRSRGAQRTRLRRTPGTPAPALWVAMLMLGIVLPLIFAAQETVTGEAYTSPPGYFPSARDEQTYSSLPEANNPRAGHRSR